MMNRRSTGWLLLLAWPCVAAGLLIFAEWASRVFQWSLSPVERFMSHFLFASAIGAAIGGFCLTEGMPQNRRPIFIGVVFSLGCVVFGLTVFVTDKAFGWR